MANQEHVEVIKQGVEVWNEWRRKCPDIRPDLIGAHLVKFNLSNADLRGTNFGDANLSQANLAEADISFTDLTRVNLSEANLSNANLSRADLTDTNVSNANLYKCYLYGSNFLATNLKGTDFKGVIIGRSQFCDVDFSGAKNLEAVEFGWRSEISLSTFINSKNTIPLSFLRGCGIPEDFISYLPTLFSNSVDYYSAFISYSHKDKIFAHHLYDFLQSKGIRCWLDSHQLLPGHHILDEVDHGIKMWDKTIFCASKYSLNSDWVDREITRVFDKESRIRKVRGQQVKALIPLDLDGYIFKGWKSSRASDVKNRVIANFTGWETDNAKMRREFERVLKALRTDEGREKPPKSGLE